MLIAKSQAVQLITNEDVAANREGTIYPAVLQAKVERVALKHYFLAQIWYAVGGNGIEDSFKDRPGDITVRFPYLTTTSPGTKNTIARARFQANRRMFNTNKSGFEGVSLTVDHKWKAQLRFKGKHVLSKTVETMTEAKEAYREAVKKYLTPYLAEGVGIHTPDRSDR